VPPSHPPHVADDPLFFLAVCSLFSECVNSTDEFDFTRCSALSLQDCATGFGCFSCVDHSVDAFGAEYFTPQCRFSPAHRCRLPSSPFANSWQLTGQRQCPTYVFAAAAPVDLTGFGDGDCALCGSLGGILDRSLSDLPLSLQSSLGAVPLTPPVVPPQCSVERLSACQGMITAAQCAAAANQADCMWCANRKGGGAQTAGIPDGQCLFAPSTACVLGGRRYTRQCNAQCDLASIGCTALRSRAECDAGTVNQGGATQSACVWCDSTARCTSPSRCQFGGNWAYACQDVLQGEAPTDALNAIGELVPSCSTATVDHIARCAALNTSAVFCNSVAGCQLCNLPDRFAPQTSRLACVYAPRSADAAATPACSWQSQLYRTDSCPVVIQRPEQCLNRVAAASPYGQYAGHSKPGRRSIGILGVCAPCRLLRTPC
jgi:hypothetical protein